jgi:hypothetical protein
MCDWQVELALPAPQSKSVATYLKAQGIKLKRMGMELGLDPLAGQDMQAAQAAAEGKVPATAKAAAPVPAQAGDEQLPAAASSSTGEAAAAEAARMATEAATNAYRFVLSAENSARTASRDYPGSWAVAASRDAHDASKCLENALKAAKAAKDSAAYAGTSGATAADVQRHVQRAIEYSNKAQQEARKARWFSQQALSHAADAVAAGRKHPYSDRECDALDMLQYRQLLVEVTPCEMKRLLKRYLLAKFCCLALADEQVGQTVSPG